MKKTILLALLSCFFVSARCQRNFDVLHYRYELELSDKTDSVYGKATIKVRFLAESPGIRFDLVSPGKNGKGMSAYTIMEDGSVPVEAVHSGNEISLNFSTKKSANDTASFTVYFRGIPADGLIISRNMYGNRTFFADNWPNRAHHWIPCVDDPADKATVEFLVTAPSHYQVISNGIQLEEINLTADKKFTHWSEDIPLPTKVMVIGVADFAVQHAGFVNNCIPVSSWVFPETMDKGFYDYAIGRDIVAFFDQYIGPYPYKKLANVQSKTIYGGMENAGAIFYYESSVTGRRSEEGLFSHEIAHQWFGDMATEKTFAHLWLSEGFATYLTHIYMESKYGTDSLNARMKEDREAVLDFVRQSKRPVVDSTPNYKSLLNANSYQKGGWVLHMLRRELGDAVFHESIRRYYAQYAGGNAGTSDFQRIVEEVSGRDLGQFFRQWLYTAVNPRVSVSWKYVPKEKNLLLTITQLQAAAPFEFPLELRLDMGENKSLLKEIVVSKQAETFTIPLGNAVHSIIADPEVSLLAEITISQEK
ncbi:MAG: M1 family metallopeptidase [Sphingobacteriales bacterium]|nr:M1 family metallopeptidase [Sphingobacteriales bacterium]